MWLMVEVVVDGVVEVFLGSGIFYCNGYIILLGCLYYFIVLKVKIDPLLQYVCM